MVKFAITSGRGRKLRIDPRVQ